MKRHCFLVTLSAVMVLTMLLALSSALAKPVVASQVDTEPIVRVGYVQEPGFFQKTSDGEYRGYAVDLLYTVEQYANLKIEWVEFTNYEDEDNALLAGDIDIEATVPKSSEYEARFLFSENAVGWNNQSIVVPDSDTQTGYGDIEACKKLRFAALTGDAVVPNFLAWCDENDFEPDITYYSTFDELDAAIRSGEVDAYVTAAMPDTGYRVIANYVSVQFFVMFNKNDTDLKATIDNALMTIKIDDPLFIQRLHDRYQSDGANVDNSLTSTESTYLQEHGPVKVAMQKDDKPFSYLDSDGTFSGVIPDYYAVLAQTEGIDFTYVGYDTQKQVIEAVQSGEADVVGLYSGDVFSSHNDSLYLTNYYRYMNVVRITKSDSGTSTTVALLERDASCIGGYLDGENIKTYSNINVCYEALDHGDVGSIVCELPTATWLLNQHRSAELGITVVSSVTYGIVGAVLSGNTMLRSIMNKAIASSGSKIDGVITQNTLTEDSFQTLLNRIPITFLFVFALILAVVVILLAASLVMLRKRQRAGALIEKQRAEAEHQRILADASEKSAAEKNAFFSNISHDMRTPLNAITGFIRMAREDDVSEEQRNGYLEKAETSSVLLIDLIDDTLTISKANQGKLALHLEPVRIIDLFDAVCVPIRESAERKGIVFIADDTGAADRMVMADKVNVRKVFLNLLSNAVKYTPAGGTVRFRFYDEGEQGAAGEAAREDEKRGGAQGEARQAGEAHDSVFIVSDDGIGISPDFLSHIFEPFSQENRHGYETLGSGLGLSIVKQLIDLMGGTIEVQSEKDKGTTFSVRLHLEEAAGESTKTSQGGAQKAVGDLTGKRVLLCEDNELNMEIAVHLLESAGIAVDTAENGAIGVEKFSQGDEGAYDFVLMDVRMPVMDGLDATRAIRALRRPDAVPVPIVAMTADAFKDDIEKCLAAGMNAHVAKPIDPQNLFETLRQL